MTNYLALTLGPIYKTITQQRRTRSVFSASYLFSYIMKNLMKEMITQKPGIKDQILLPSPDFLDDKAFQQVGCGLYPDRLIMLKSEESDTQLILTARDTVIKNLADEFSKKYSIRIEYLQAYLKIYILEISLDKGSETINEINRALDNLELFDNFPYGPDQDELQRFFSEAGRHFLIVDAFGSKKNHFESLPQIATAGLSKIPEKQEVHRKNVSQMIRNSEEEEDTFYQDLQKEFGDQFSDYHKYVAVVNVDGDSFGKHIGNMEADETDLKTFSKQLIKFGAEARKIITDYGGAPVYIGGDDLLFFAPVASKFSGEDSLATIFHLVQRIDNEFYTFFPPSSKSPSLSYGISLSYYKYPLNEALIESYQLLERAKDKYVHDDKRKYPNKNAIAFKVLKHSGQFFEGVIEKDKPGIGDKEREAEQLPYIGIFDQIMSLLDEQISGNQFINSLTHGMAFFQDLFEVLLLESEELNEQAIQNMFDNNFDESIHKQNKAFIDQVVQYVIQVYKRTRYVKEKYPGSYKKTETVNEANDAALKLIYATLRFIHFIRGSQVLQHA